MKYKQWSKRNPAKNYFQMPNEIFLLGLSPGVLVVYSYLLCCENRKTYQCWPSYKTIGKAVGMSQNTVRKYVYELEKRQLIRTESTTIVTKDGLKHPQSYEAACQNRMAGVRHPVNSAPPKISR